MSEFKALPNPFLFANLIGRTMPDLMLLGRDFKQLDLFLALPGGAK